MNLGFKKTTPSAILGTLCLLYAANLFATETPLTFVGITPCRLVDSRNTIADLGGHGTNGPTVFSASASFGNNHYASISGLNQTASATASAVQAMPGRTCSSETITAVLATSPSVDWTAQLNKNSSGSSIVCSGNTGTTTCSAQASVSIATDLIAFEVYPGTFGPTLGSASISMTCN